MESIVLVGGGGHCKSVIDTILSGDLFNIVGIVDLLEERGKEVLGQKVIASDDDLLALFQKGYKNAAITIGSIGVPYKRIELFNKVKEIGFDLPTIIDKSALVSRDCIIGEGTFIGKGAIINAGTIIGKGAIINSGAIIDHDCQIGDFVHIAPGVTMSGSVVVGDRSHLGTGATVIQDITIGADTMVGAGSVIVKDISSNVKAYGNPCREVK